jgi:hypothetical protein
MRRARVHSGSLRCTLQYRKPVCGAAPLARRRQKGDFRPKPCDYGGGGGAGAAASGLSRVAAGRLAGWVAGGFVLDKRK